MGLTKTQRAFLHGMMAARVLSERRTAALYLRCTVDAAKLSGRELSAHASAIPDEDKLDTYIGAVNVPLEKFHIQLRKGYSPCDNGTFWGVVNTINDESSKLASEYQPPQVALFQSIVQALLEVEEARMTMSDAQALGPELERNLTLKISEAGKAIQSFHKARWLRQIKPSAGVGGVVMVTFGVRAVLELPDVKSHVARHAAVMKRLSRGDKGDKGDRSDGGGAGQRRKRGSSRRVLHSDSDGEEEEGDEQKPEKQDVDDEEKAGADESDDEEE